MFENEIKRERAIAISVKRKGIDRSESLEHLDELAFLSETAGADVIQKIYQELENPNPATVIGKGKVEEIKNIISDENISLLIFDDDLTSAQIRNLSNELKVKILDRSGIILDIFANRAKTLEAKTQVELAQLQYLLPRLTRMWTHLSKQYGGIGTKGPGETQIETDRRIIRQRIGKLKEKIDDISIHKELIKKNRESLPCFALVGYTNTGKSTLMKAITSSDVYIEDKLFATLDTTIRSFYLPNGRKALLSDTVGFIRKLPAHLIASFQSTLSEASDADVLIHVVDVSLENFQEQVNVVDETLQILKISDKPTIIAFNKIDKLDELNEIFHLKEDYPNSIFISAERGINIHSLLDLIQAIYEKSSKLASIKLPYSDMNQISNLYDNFEIVKRDDKEDGIYFEIKVPGSKITMFKQMFGKYRDK